MTAPSANVAEALRREIAHRPCSSLMVPRQERDAHAESHHHRTRGGLFKQGLVK